MPAACKFPHYILLKLPAISQPWGSLCTQTAEQPSPRPQGHLCNICSSALLKIREMMHVMQLWSGLCREWCNCQRGKQETPMGLNLSKPWAAGARRAFIHQAQQGQRAAPRLLHLSWRTRRRPRWAVTPTPGRDHHKLSLETCPQFQPLMFHWLGSALNSQWKISKVVRDTGRHGWEWLTGLRTPRNPHVGIK